MPRQALTRIDTGPSDLLRRPTPVVNHSIDAIGVSQRVKLAPVAGKRTFIE